MRRYLIKRSGSAGVTQYQRNELANALWIALHFIDDGPSGLSTTLIDTKTGVEYDTDQIRELAAQTPAWQNSSFEAPDANRP
jgi:hypothetical protein